MSNRAKAKSAKPISQGFYIRNVPALERVGIKNSSSTSLASAFAKASSPNGENIWYVSFKRRQGGEARAHKGDRDVSERARGQEIRESEVGRNPKNQCGHAQSLSAETDHRPSTDAWLLDEPDEDVDEYGHRSLANLRRPLPALTGFVFRRSEVVYRLTVVPTRDILNHGDKPGASPK